VRRLRKRARERIARSRPPVGARPGTLIIPPDAPRPRIRAIRYDAEHVEEYEDIPASRCAALDTPGSVVWIDVRGFGDEATLRALGKAFSIHPLALEDVNSSNQRPKTEAYPNHQFYVSRTACLDAEGHIERRQVSVFFSREHVLTFQANETVVLESVRERLRQGAGLMRRSAGDYLAYAIIDTLIDGVFPVMELLGDELEQLESDAIADPGPATLERINAVRHELQSVRRAIWPQREAVNSLIRDVQDFVSDEVRVYLRDSYDHCIQLGELVESHREVASALMTTYLSSMANRTNEVMKVLTVMASIFIPLTFLAGVYGMNFHDMPELGWPGAYPALLALMLAIAGGMLFFFWRNGWIGSRRRPVAPPDPDAR
jgi:magnesium transporter